MSRSYAGCLGGRRAFGHATIEVVAGPGSRTLDVPPRRRRDKTDARGSIPGDLPLAGRGVLLLRVPSWRRRPSDEEEAEWGQSRPYECGIVPDKEPPSRFPVRFYLVAMIFIISTSRSSPLSLRRDLRQLGSFGLVEVLIFSVVVFVSLLYLVSTGALSWAPPSASRAACRRARPSPPSRDHPQRRTAPRPTRRHRAMDLEDLQHNFLTGKVETWSSGLASRVSGRRPSASLLRNRDDVRRCC